MEVFIVRPFGKQRKVLKKKGEEYEVVEFDFEGVEHLLIRPAMEAVELDGGTTKEVFVPGDIREDMFSELLKADIVIADITIHNANVFYELGIRHALRDKITILIKAEGFDATPFDIIGYRYLAYDEKEPGKEVENLISTLRDATNERNRRDSPVFNILPTLKAQDPENFIAIPEDFIEEVRIAKAAKQIGKLTLMADESEDFSWKIPAHRCIGNELFYLEENAASRKIWENIRQAKRGDIQANDRLATIYQRLAGKELAGNPAESMRLLEQSNISIDVLLTDSNITGRKNAEAYALKARNAKTLWANSWEHLADKTSKQKTALTSEHLKTAIINYTQGFEEDLNHYYPGINALSLLTTLISLANRYPDDWNTLFDNDDEARSKLDAYKKSLEKISKTLEYSLETEEKRLSAAKKNSLWLKISQADFSLLTLTKANRVAQRYQTAFQTANEQEKESASRQLRLLAQLDIQPDNVTAALHAIGALGEQAQKSTHYLLFTGHMIDNPDRKDPRFPQSKEGIVREKIRQQIELEQKKLAQNQELKGIAGGACGGDILFHEVCQELGIQSEMYLALPEDQFKAESVSFAGNDWVERFNKLINKLPHHELSQSKKLPKWLSKKTNYSIWERNNLWELNAALVNGGINMTLIALWDRKGGDGPGGTQHMVETAKEKGAMVVIIDIADLKTTS